MSAAAASYRLLLTVLLADYSLPCRFLVFFMQVGFIAVETGSGRAKNVRNILLKNLLDTMLTAVCWWAVGYAFAYGQTAGGFIGYVNVVCLSYIV